MYIYIVLNRWGIAGICPGPGLVALGARGIEASLFVPSVIIGIACNELLFGQSFQWSATTTTKKD